MGRHKLKNKRVERDNKRLFKRFSNRKLYDYSTSSYLNLEEFLDVAKEENGVMVIDGNGDDISYEVKLKAIFSKEMSNLSSNRENVLDAVLKTETGKLTDFIYNNGGKNV